jgi:hypothetical protein
VNSPAKDVDRDRTMMIAGIIEFGSLLAMRREETAFDDSHREETERTEVCGLGQPNG